MIIRIITWNCLWSLDVWRLISIFCIHNVAVVFRIFELSSVWSAKLLAVKDNVNKLERVAVSFVKMISFESWFIISWFKIQTNLSSTISAIYSSLFGSCISQISCKASNSFQLPLLFCHYILFHANCQYNLILCVN